MNYRKLKKSAAVAGIILSVVMLMSGCGKKSNASPANVTNNALAGEAYYGGDDYYYEDMYDYVGAEPAYEENYKTESTVDFEDGARALDSGNIVDSGSASVGNNQNRKLIRTVDLDVETKEYDKLKIGIEEQIKQLGGYVEQEYSYNGNAYGLNNSRARYSTMTIRIPDDKLDEFVTVMSGMSNVISKNTTATDVTLQYTDIESKRDMYRAELESLTALLEKAESVEDVTYITQRITDVRYNIESMERQLRVMDNQVDYATVSMHITEVEVLTPQVADQKTPGEEMREGFKSSFLDVVNQLKNFGMNFVINLPYIIRVLIILGIIFGIIRLTIHIIVKSVKKKKAKKAAKKAAEAAGEAKEGKAEETKAEEVKAEDAKSEK